MSILRKIVRRVRGHAPPDPLQVEHLDLAQYEHLYDELVQAHPENQREYFRFHHRRYYELLNAMQVLLAECPTPRVLELGVSGFLPLYKKLFPSVRLVTADRPVEDGGVNAEYCVGVCGTENHYNVDLNRVLLSPNWGEPPLGTFDYIVFTEVLEHLATNPIELLNSLIGLLNSGGYLYLTTPNFFQYHNIGKMERRENPQHVFPRRGENWDAHHHFREYDMNELVRFVGEAGGRVAHSYFSDCWDNPVLIRSVLRRHPEQKSNLVIVAQHQNGRAPV